ncbi:LOW QUALITY PROTEIN: Med10 domain-containing protein, partial [Cephalotus follicularis]
MDLSQNSSVGSGSNGTITTPTNDNTVDDPKQNLSQVINSIQKTLGLLHQLYLTVSSLNAASQLPLLQRLYNSLVMEFDNMVKLSEKCNIQVWVFSVMVDHLIYLIDDGKNDEFTRDVLNSCISKNQITRGKADAFNQPVTLQSLRKHLLEELEQTFPDEIESYREIRASSTAVSSQ